MPYKPDIHNRRSIRLQGYDYFPLPLQLNTHFVTILRL